MAASKKQKYAFVRSEDAPVLPPPASQAGITGWLWQNIFASMADYSSLGASIISLMVALLSVCILYFGGIQIYGLIDFAIFSDQLALDSFPAKSLMKSFLGIFPLLTIMV